jgi:medium-chain acyl-[acyl-carrier-protein] hydrolase
MTGTDRGRVLTRVGNNRNLWFRQPKPNPRAVMRLFCFPYAGGNATIFRDWPQTLIDSVEICVANLPGRGERRLEQPLTRLLPVVHAIAQAIAPWLDKPFAFFGHSMGALISFELARHLRTTNGPLPVQLFLSGRRAPHLPDPYPLRHTYPESEFTKELRRLNGTPREILDNPELLRLMIPLLRADFAACETYQYRPEPPLTCPMSLFGGSQDQDISQQDLEAWRRHTTKTFKLHMIPGDHFYLITARDSLVQELNKEILQTQLELAMLQ